MKPRFPLSPFSKYYFYISEMYFVFQAVPAVYNFVINIYFCLLKAMIPARL